jgi:hypothetical protein
MSLEDKMIQDFIQLVETQWPLFADYQGELEALVKNLPSDKEGMSDAIASWCESHPSVQDAMSESQEGDRVPGTQGNAPPPPDPKIYQEMLQNKIRRHQSSSQNKP